MDVRWKNDAIKNRPTYGNPSETIRGNVKKELRSRRKELAFRSFTPEIAELMLYSEEIWEAYKINFS